MTVRPRGAGYQADLMLGGKRLRPMFLTEAAALTWESEAKLANKLGMPIPEPTAGVKTKGDAALKTIEDFHKLCVRERWAGRKASAKLGRNAEMFLEWKGRNTPIKDITSRDLYNFAMHCRENLGNDNATVNRKLSAVKVILRKAVHERVIGVVPYVEKFKETSTGSLDFLDFGEEDALIRQLDHLGLQRLSQLVIFLLDTGARISEAHGLTYDTITASHIVFPDRKSGRSSAVTMTTRVKAVLGQCRIDSTDPERPFGDLNLDTARRHLRVAFDKLGGKYAKITQPFHIMRHSCASRLAMRGVDANRIKNWMDHGSLVVTQRYMKLSPSALDEVAVALEPRSSPQLRVVGD